MNESSSLNSIGVSFHRASSQPQLAAREIHFHLAEAATLLVRFPAGTPQRVA
jgi:hypothetical protein